MASKELEAGTTPDQNVTPEDSRRKGKRDNAEEADASLEEKDTEKESTRASTEEKEAYGRHHADYASGISSGSSSARSSVHRPEADRDAMENEPRLMPITQTASRASAAATVRSQAQSEHLSSSGLEMPAQPCSSYAEIPDEFYDRLSPRRKTIIVGMLAYCSFLAPISSTAPLAALRNIAEEYGTTGTIIGVSNALYMVFMGLSPLLWGPMSEVYGRRWILLSTVTTFVASSIGTALAPNLAAYFVFRILTAFEGTAFIVVGSSCIGDIYRPTERATAMGWFLSGTLFGPALGPFVGGILVTYRSWRVIFWLQTALAGVGLACVAVLLPETIYHRKIDNLQGYRTSAKARVLGSMMNPVRVLRLYRYPNVIIAGAVASALVWNQYSLLTPITYVLNPRFGLTTPMQSGLFYLAPGCGYVTGTLMGGRYADYMVRKWIVRRGGERVPEDRLRSALPFLGLAIPACMIIYGWSVQRQVGGIPLVVIVMFLQGVAQLFCFPSVNTYCLDVMQERGSEVISGNYFVRFLFAGVGTAVALPAVEAIGVGWFSTISAAFLALSAVGLGANVLWGRGWREQIKRKEDEKRQAKYDRNRAELNQGEAAA